MIWLIAWAVVAIVALTFFIIAVKGAPRFPWEETNPKGEIDNSDLARRQR